MSGGGSRFGQPAGLERRIDSDLPATELAGRLARAAAEGRTSTRMDGSPYIVRLGGTVTRAGVDLEARLLRADGTRGRPKRPLRILGRVTDQAAGSTLDVRIVPDDRSTWIWLVAIPALTVVLMLLARIAPVAIGLIGVATVPYVVLAVRAGQRFALRYVSQVEALLEAIARGG
jgi:hypothetical protein